MSHTALQCFRLGCVNECAASGADSHACSRHECPLMSRSGGGERHDGSDGGGRHGTEGGKKGDPCSGEAAPYGKRITVALVRSLSPPPTSHSFSPSAPPCSFPFLCLFLFIAHSIISPLLRNTPLHSLGSRSDISALTRRGTMQGSLET